MEKKITDKLIAGVDYIGIAVPFYCNDGKGNFLIHQRGKLSRDEKGLWDFGSGQIDFGEDLEKGMLREVAEEYGCKGTIQDKLPAHSIIRVLDGRKTHWLVIPFFVKINPKQVSFTKNKKVTNVGWFKLSNLPKPFHSGAKFTMKNYRTHFEKYLNS